jgi:glycosyltransferase involved in cell wall biosynthesis
MWGSRSLQATLKEEIYDILLLNGFYDKKLTIPALTLRKLGLIPRRPTILSPRGEFAQGAMSLRAGRKRLYRGVVRLTGLTSDIWLHATADHERRDIEAAGLSCRGLLQAQNVRLLPDRTEQAPVAGSGPLRIVFLGRVSPVKNLEFALDVLMRVTVPVSFNIYGPIVDAAYWDRLEKLIIKLPGHINVTAHGALAHTQVADKLITHDLFFLPTLGENFGHAINEALSAGLPVLISDKTPWRGLAEQGVGWDLPLNMPEAFSAAIETFSKTSTEERLLCRQRARALAERSFAESDAVETNRRMLHRVLED